MRFDIIRIDLQFNIVSLLLKPHSAGEASSNRHSSCRYWNSLQLVGYILLKVHDCLEMGSFEVFQFQKEKKKWQGLKSDEQGGWGAKRMFLLVKKLYWKLFCLFRLIHKKKDIIKVIEVGSNEIKKEIFLCLLQIPDEDARYTSKRCLM